jgi:hypothetical protein
MSSTKSSVTHVSKNSQRLVVSSRTAQRLRQEHLDEKLKNAIHETKKKSTPRSPPVPRSKEHNTPTKLAKLNKIPFRVNLPYIKISLVNENPTSG